MIGGGYVGLVSGACFAEFGMDVTIVEADDLKLGALKEGRIPIFFKSVPSDILTEPAMLRPRPMC